MKKFYEFFYRYFRALSDIGARSELVTLVESGRIKPGSAIDLGCGTGANAIYLAQHGFEVTGVDYAEAVIEKAQELAKANGVQVKFFIISPLACVRLSSVSKRILRSRKLPGSWIGQSGLRVMQHI